MEYKQQFIQYLIEKKKDTSCIEEYVSYMDQLTAAFDAQNTAPEAIHDFIDHTRSWSRAAVKTAYQFLDEYAKFIKKEQPSITDAIRLGCRKIFEQTAKDDARKRKQDIIPIPATTKINPKHLGVITNEQFVAAYSELQQFVSACYDDIEKDPFAWGYPDFYTTSGYYNRVNNILFALVFCGKYRSGMLAVDTAKFLARTDVKRHKNVEMMISGFERMGLVFKSFDNKSKEFSVSYPNNPHIITVLHAYVSEIDGNMPDWRYFTPRNSFSYRFVECVSVQSHETAFLAEFDYMPPALQDIQKWLYAEAAKCGFDIDPKEPLEKGCILYKKGSKRWLLVGQPWFSWTSSKEIYAKAIFRSVLTHSDMTELFRRFPDTFRPNCRGCSGNKPCTMRIEFSVDGQSRRCCAYNSFLFKNPALDDIKLILKFYKREYKIDIE